MKSLIMPSVLALGFHGLILGLFLIDWPDDARTQIRPELLYVTASLVTKDRLDTAEFEETKQDSVQREAVVKAMIVDDPEMPASAGPVTQPKQPRSPQLTEQQVQDAAESRAQEKNREQALRADQRLRDAAAAEQAARMASLDAAVTDEMGREAVTNDEQVMAYIGQIQRDIINKWSRPPSARNGMEAVLRVRLVPTGEVVDVVVEEGSRNDAFDRSAVQAVRRAERFEVPGDRRLFEQNFRSFTVLFRPEDLRL